MRAEGLEGSKLVVWGVQVLVLLGVEDLCFSPRELELALAVAEI